MAEPSGLLSVVIPPLDGEYIYRFDPAEHGEVHAGCIVEVFLGSRRTHGFVISVNSEREEKALAETRARSIKIKSIPSQSAPVRAFAHHRLPIERKAEA